ncbi:MAG: 2'-5' RNA ligase family protein [Ilumatobacteraceae bacterium]
MLRRAIVLFVPPPVADRIDAIRRRWDPVMTDRIGAHITLVHDVVDHERARELVAAAARSAPFTVTLTHADRWGRSSNGIYLHVDDPTGSVAALHEQLAELEQPAWSRVAFRAHATLIHGRTVTPEDAAAAWAALDGFRADWDVDIGAIDTIELAEPRWRFVERIELRAASVPD